MKHINSIFLIDVDNMNQFNWENSREEGDKLLFKIEDELNLIDRKVVKELTRRSDEFQIITQLTNLDDCIDFGNMILRKVQQYDVTATVVFTLITIQENNENLINKLKVGLLKTKSNHKNIIGYIE